jgi:hypothetical protein
VLPMKGLHFLVYVSDSEFSHYRLRSVLGVIDFRNNISLSVVIV